MIKTDRELNKSTERDREAETKISVKNTSMTDRNTQTRDSDKGGGRKRDSLTKTPSGKGTRSSLYPSYCPCSL